MLHLIGLGLDWKDISLKAIDAIKKSEKIYLEGYTSLANYTPMQLSKLIKKEIIVLDREHTEDFSFLKDANRKDICLLVYGDALSATTHFEIIAECRKRKIKFDITHSPSILTAIAETGLSLYKFGKTASIPFQQENFSPTSFFDILADNRKISAHTLFLLDLLPNEKKFLTVKDAISILLKIAREKNKDIFNENTLVVGCARLGQKNKQIIAGKAKLVMKKDFGKPPYCLIVPAELNFKEQEYLGV